MSGRNPRRRGNRDQLADAAAKANDRAAVLYQNYRLNGDIQLLQSAVTLFREAVDATPAGHPSRPAMLSNLGAALRARFERAGQLTDLDQAITAGRAAVASTPAGQP